MAPIPRIGLKEPDGLTLHQALKQPLRVRRGAVNIMEGVSGCEICLNIEEASLSKSVSPYVLDLNTVHGDGPCEVYGRVVGVESAEESL